MTQYKLVPVAPTEEMIAALESALADEHTSTEVIRRVIATAPEINPWVSMKERTPEKDDEYFVWYEQNDMPSTNFWHGGWIEGCPSHWWDESILPIPRLKT